LPLGLRGARARTWMVSSALVLLASTRSARAAGSDFELAWSAPEGCPSRQEIVDAARARLSESRRPAVPPDFFVQGTVTAERGGFLITLTLKDELGRAGGEREVRVEGTQCKAVKEPAALLLALIIATRPRAESGERTEPPPSSDASAAPSHVESGDDAPSPPPTTHPPATVRAEPSAPAARSSGVPPSRVSIAAAGVASLGLLPDAGLGGAIRATYARGSLLFVGLEASFEAGGSVRAGTGEVGFQFFGASALVGLPVLRTSHVEIVLAAQLRAGAIRTEPTGFAILRREVTTAALAGPGVLIRTKLAPNVFAEALPGIDAILIRDHFRIRDGDKLDVHRPAPIGARLSLGLAYEFR